jgi:hypothetical protein
VEEALAMPREYLAHARDVGSIETQSQDAHV